LIELILDGKIKGKVDQLNGRVELERLFVFISLSCLTTRRTESPSRRRNTKQADRYNAMASWSSQLKTISTTLLQKGPTKTAGPEGELGMGGPWAMSPLELEGSSGKNGGETMAFGLGGRGFWGRLR
jgi:hypothetical protein